MWIPKGGAARHGLMCAVATAAILAASPVWAQERSFKIPSLPAASGVTEFARQAGVQILVSAEAAQGKHTAAVSGSMSVPQALTNLLAGTGLAVTGNNGRTITIAPAPAPAHLIPTRWAPEVASVFVAATAEAAAAPPAAEVQEVVVTGSHLLGNLTAPTPVTEIGSAQIQQKAAGTVSEFLKDIPQFATSTGPANASSGAQSASKATIGLYNLGATRTLVLINGNRHVADGTGNVFDTNLIPTSLIDRVDVVTGGASAAYGSDAVAGVVNFVLKNRMEGLHIDVHEGISQYGDNVEFSPSFAWGKSFLDDRLHVVVGGDYTDNKGTKNFYSRPWGKKEPGIVTIAASSISTAQRVAMGLPANIFSNNVRTSAYNATGLIVSGPLKGTAFDDGGLTHQFNYGTLNGGTVTIGGGDYGSVLNPDEYIKADYDRAAVMGRMEFEFTPTTIGYFQLGWGDLHTRGYSFGARVPNFSAYPVLINNPFLPASVVAAMKANNLTQFAYSATRDFDLGSIHAFNRTETVQSNFGVKGEFDAFGKNWKWDVNGGAGKSTFAPDIHNTPITADFYESAYVVPGPNGPVCGPIASNPYFNAQPAIVKAALISQVTPGCVPYNIFGNNLAANQAAIAYFNNASQADFEFRQYTATADIAGSPFSLPAGPVSMAAGFDWRKETLSSVNCPECQLGALMNQNYSLFSGAVNVKEVYGEMGAPILRDLPFVRNLDLNAAVRETDYSTSGKVTTWKIGATWDVNDMVRLRLTKSHDIRAPNINELFNPGSEGNPQVTNPINNAQGFIKSNTVGNPDLKPEIGDTITAGIVFRPTWEWAQGFTASVDYWSIHLGNAISTLAVQDVINGCLQRGDSSLCQYLTFDNTPLGIARVNSPNLNLNAQKTDGFNIEFDYAVPLERLSLPGTLSIRTLGLYTQNAKTIAGNVETNAVDTAASPRFYATALFSYALGPAKLNLTARYTSTIRYSTTLIGPDDPSYNIASTNSINKNLWSVPVYWSGAFAYDFENGPGVSRQVYFNIDNIFNKNPPIVAWVISGGPYDLVGRSFKLGFRLNY